jgi:REP element-mobilizing transposase RayT
MPRQPRLDIPNVLHHVIVRGIERRDIFADDADKERFLARLSALLTKNSTKCYAWALLTNHFHLLLMPTTVSLSETMRRLLTGYAVYNLEGQETGEVLARFGKSRTHALRGYRQFVADGVAVGHRDELAGGGLKRSMLRNEDQREFSAFDERILGSGAFVEMLTQEECPGERRHKPPLALGDLLQYVCEATEVEAAKLKHPGRERDVARARAIFCCLAVHEYGYTAKEAGQTAGLGSAGASIAVKRGRDLLKSDQALRDRVLERVD